MTKKQLQLFATTSDLLKVIDEVDAGRPLEFVTMGLFDQSTPGMSERQQLRALNTYLVIDKGAKIGVTAVPQRRGGIKYAVDQLMNPDSLALSMGGCLDAGRLVAGHMGTASESAISAELYALFAKSIRRHFQCIKSYYVGPEAVRLLDEGVRLMATQKAPPIYDLTR